MKKKDKLIAKKLKSRLSRIVKLADFKADVNPHSIVNRAYYSVFYMVLALFIKSDIRIKISEHTGILSLFDKEFLHTKKIDKKYSEIYHKLFDFRQESDYKDLIKVTRDE